ncbi:unnamed protein product [Fusarium fujikuroi]|nr:unnamed protein product [Fusarium fujikuroi]VZI04360.1 unnamed protein product [Fusarium fujikuroi]
MQSSPRVVQRQTTLRQALSAIGLGQKDIISQARLRALPKTIRCWLIDEKIQYRLALRRLFLTEEAA